MGYECVGEWIVENGHSDGHNQIEQHVENGAFGKMYFRRNYIDASSMSVGLEKHKFFLFLFGFLSQKTKFFDFFSSKKFFDFFISKNKVF